MKSSLVLSVFLLLVLTAKSQVKDTISTETVYTVAEKQPEFPGGQAAFINYLSMQLQYPKDSWDKHIGGKVILSFIVERDGTITGAKILRHVADDLDAEAIRVISSSPKWKPGIQNNNPVRVTYSLPITFSAPPTLKKDTVSQTSDTSQFKRVETQPEYPGGLEVLFKFVKKNLRSRGEEGKVITSFVVEKDGSLTDIKIVKSLSKTADEEALRVIGLMPKWKPAMQEGRPVRVLYTVPISFPMN